MPAGACRSGASHAIFGPRSAFSTLRRAAVGSDCNKVGSSFSAFRNQPNACGRAPQVSPPAAPAAALHRRRSPSPPAPWHSDTFPLSFNPAVDRAQCAAARHASCRLRAVPARASQTCLSGQLKDLWDADVARIADGRVPLHMVTRLTGGDDTTVSLGCARAATKGHAQRMPGRLGVRPAAHAMYARVASRRPAARQALQVAPPNLRQFRHERL
jgi:hypothetical protein